MLFAGPLIIAHYIIIFGILTSSRTARPSKIEALQAAPVADNVDFSLVQIDDIATSDLSDALKGY